MQGATHYGNKAGQFGHLPLKRRIMKLTKEDFMRLPKERLAELLVEMQDQVRIETITVPAPVPNTIEPEPWWRHPLISHTDGDATFIVQN